MLSTVDRTKPLVALPTMRRPSRASGQPVRADRLSHAAAEVLSIIADPRTPAFVTVFANDRRRYSYWRPFDPTTGSGGCYTALPTTDCDALHAAGRITLGEPVVDPNRTTYRVRTADRVQPATLRSVPQERQERQERQETQERPRVA